MYPTLYVLSSRGIVLRHSESHGVRVTIVSMQEMVSIRVSSRWVVGRDQDTVTLVQPEGRLEQHITTSETLDMIGVLGNANHGKTSRGHLREAANITTEEGTTKVTAKDEISGFVHSGEGAIESAFSVNALNNAARSLYTAKGETCPVQIVSRNGQSYLINRNIISNNNGVNTNVG